MVAISRQNKKSNSSMVWEGDNYNDEYNVPIQTSSIQRIVNPNIFIQEASIALGVLTLHYNALLQTSRPGSIETIKNEPANVSIFKETMDQMDLINCNSDDGSTNLANPWIPAAETS